jgi:hypothetical protein
LKAKLKPQHSAQTNLNKKVEFFKVTAPNPILAFKRPFCNSPKPNGLNPKRKTKTNKPKRRARINCFL